MLKKSIMAVLLMAAALPLLSQEWETKLEDYYTYSKINNSTVTRDGEVLLVGCVGDAATERNSCVIKVNQDDGDIDIHVFPNDTLYTAISDIVQLSNGNYFAFGVCSYDGSEYLCPFIMVFDEDFSILNEQYIDVLGDTFLKYGKGPMVMDDDGNIIIICDVMVSTTGTVNTWGCVLIKFSGEGEELKRKYVSDGYYLRALRAESMLNVPDSDEILVLGDYRENDGLVFFDTDLNFLRGYNIHQEDFTVIHLLGMFTGDDRLVTYVDGQDLFPTYPYIGDTIYARVCLTDLQGEPTACREFKPTNGGRFIASAVRRGFSSVNDDYFYLLANEEQWTWGPTDPHIYLMDTDLNVIGHKVLPTVGDRDYPEVITHTPDGGCILCTNYHTSKGGCEHIVKFPVTDFDPTWSVGEAEKADITSDVYPNPATNTLHLNIDEDATLSITDIQGRKLLQKNVSGGDNEIDISGLNSGMYIYQVSGNDLENKIGKFIKK